MEMSLSDIAETLGGTCSGDGDKIIKGVGPFENAASDQITFASESKYIDKIEETGAGAVIVPEGSPKELPGNLVFVANPRLAFVELMKIFAPHREIEAFVSPSASIGTNCTKGDHVHISAMVAIGDNVTLGDRVYISPGVVIGDNVVIGDDVKIHPNVSILDGCRLGKRVIVNAGSVIGSDGYGFTPDGTRYVKIPHTGIVQIDDDVEIGALNAIDRATSGKTRIRRGVKTDNMVHIAHNVEVGEDTLLVAQVGIAGSTKVGNHAILAGKVGVAGHLTIGDNVMVGPAAGILKSVDDNEVVSGAPAMPHRLWLRVQNLVTRLPEFKKRLSSLEKRLNRIEESNK